MLKNCAHLNEGELIAIIRRFDVDADCKVSYVEFVDFMTEGSWKDEPIRSSASSPLKQSPGKPSPA